MEVKNPERGLTEGLNQQFRDSGLPICTPQSPDLIPVRLPSLTSSVTSSQWRLSCEENSRVSNHPQLIEDTSERKHPTQDSSELDEAAINCATSQTSEIITGSTSPPRSHSPFATLAYDNRKMRPSFSSTSIHLQSMRISHHLRSMSTASINNSICGREGGFVNNIHDKVNTDFEDKQLPRRSRYTSSTGFESKKLPLTWGKVVKDDSSSVYSYVTQASGRSTPDFANNVRRRLSVETIRANMQAPNDSILRFNFGEDTEAASRDPGQIPEQELKKSGKTEIVTVDGGKSTPSLVDTNIKSSRQVSFAASDISIPEKQDLETKNSVILSEAPKVRARLPRSSTRIFLRKKGSINYLDGTEERKYSRSKSMYGLYSADKDIKYLGLSKRRPLGNEISTSFSFSSLKNDIKPFDDLDLDKIEDRSPSSDKTQAFRERKSMHQLKSERREPKRENSTQSHQILGSWSNYPSHTRAERTGTAGPRDLVYSKDFAPQPEGGNSISQMTDQGYKKANMTRATTKSRIAKSKSVTFGKSILKSYARFFKHQSVEFQRHGHGHKSSISVSGVTEHPELEMVASVFPTTTDNKSSQSATCQRSHLLDAKTEDSDSDPNTAKQWSQIYQNCVELSRSSEDVRKWSSSDDKFGDPTEDNAEIKVRKGSAQGHRNSILSSNISLRDSTEELAKIFQETEANECAKVLRIARDD